MTDSNLSTHEIAELSIAVDLLENLSFGIQVANKIGYPIEKAIESLPEKWKPKIAEVTTSALRSSLRVITKTFDSSVYSKPKNFLHKLTVSASGAIGGALGFFALSVELPFSTLIMLRSIADIAKSEGEDLNDVYTQLACIEVFALGGKSKKGDNSEPGYFAIRAALAKAVSEAAAYIAEKGLAEEGAPIIVRLIAIIAERFGIEISEKAAAQSIPVIGAAGGAIINFVFINHFQNIARGHFTVRRLEKRYGKDIIEYEYKKIKNNLR
ncbi:MAG: EcsC family protein [Ignavibacteriaceae bacterium]|jgi:hypothetical protein